jgi:DDE superfamily endonuclease
MARLCILPQNTDAQAMPEKDKRALAIQWLFENPEERVCAAARIYNVKNEHYLRVAYQREKSRREKGPVQRGGQNRILNEAQHQALIQYAIDQATEGGMGATKPMLRAAAAYLRRQEGKDPPSERWFSQWLKSMPSLHTIKTKPISSHRVDMHTESDLKEWFEQQYRSALVYTGILDQEQPQDYIHNMDEKGCRIAIPGGQEVVVPININDMYVGIPENRLSLTIIESICANGTADPPVVIIPGKSIMEHWFHQNMTGHELITTSSTGYTNTEINLTWLDHFIKYHQCGPTSPWRVLLLDGASSHADNDFAIRCKANKIWPVIFPSHQTHLIQPADVGCFRQWKHYQQVAVWDALRSLEPEYNVQSFFRDLPTIRAKTFTKSTIKGSFKNAGIWPISFATVRHQLQKYGKKERRKQCGIEYLEFGKDTSDEESVISTSSTTLPVFKKTPPPSSYNECYTALKSLETKVQQALSSPSRIRYTSITYKTGTLLMRGSLHEMEIENQRKRAIYVRKEKLNARKSLSKGGQLYAFQGIHQKGVKHRKEADDILKRARKVLQVTENKLKHEFYLRGVQDRKDEIVRKKAIQQLQATNQPVPKSLLIPIRDRRKEPTIEETESLRANQSLYDAVAKAEIDKETAYTENPEQELIDPMILEFEEQFAVQRGGLQRVILEASSQEESGSESECNSERSITSSIAPSIISCNSIAQNADFVRL